MEKTLKSLLRVKILTEFCCFLSNLNFFAVEDFPCKKLWRCLKKWQSVGKGQVNMVDEAKLIAQFIQFLKHRLCELWLSTVVEKNFAQSVEQCQLHVLHFGCISLIFSVYFSDAVVHWDSESYNGSDQWQTTKQLP